MFGLKNGCVLQVDESFHDLEDYQGSMARWCPGCGDNGILTAVQRLCRDEQLPPEKTVFVSGIGCAARFPHYMRTYGFHGLHGRALPVAEGIRIRRPDLHVFVNTGDGDCCSIGAAHWVHAIRRNTNMVVMLHDNNVYGLTKKQVSPTSPQGLRTNTTPYGAPLRPLNPLETTLGITNVSFVAQVVEWMPELLYAAIEAGFRHRGLAFIRILQRCPHFMADRFQSLMSNPDNFVLLEHEDGLQVSDAMKKLIRNTESHDPSNLHRAREIASWDDRIPLGLLFCDETVPCYDEIQRPKKIFDADDRRAMLESAFDRFGIFPTA